MCFKAICCGFLILRQISKRHFISLAIAGFLAASPVHAGSSPKGSSAKSLTASSACKQMSGILSAVPGADIKQTDGKFEFDGVKFQGCSFRLEGRWSALKKEIHPPDLLYPAEPDSKLYKEGWRADIQADGSDGSFFRIRKGSVFCLVTGSWDGGDDSDPKYKLKDDYSIEVQCAEQKAK